MGWLDLVDHRMSPAPTLFYSLGRRALCGNFKSANFQALPAKAAMTPILNHTSPGATNLAARGLRTAADLALTRQHGDRLRYLAGCHCSECRGANTAYERTRSAARKAGDWNGIVPADKARAHLAALSAKNVAGEASATSVVWPTPCWSTALRVAKEPLAVLDSLKANAVQDISASQTWMATSSMPAKKWLTANEFLQEAQLR
jgi:hypothetical protein